MLQQSNLVWGYVISLLQSLNYSILLISFNGVAGMCLVNAGQLLLVFYNIILHFEYFSDDFRTFAIQIFSLGYKSFKFFYFKDNILFCII